MLGSSGVVTGGDFGFVVGVAGVVGLGDLFIGAGEDSGGEENEHFGGLIGIDVGC